MDDREFELTVGDVLEINGYLVTVIDIDGTDVSFRVDSANLEDALQLEEQSVSAPRK